MIKIEPFGQDDFKTLLSWVGSENLLIQFAGPTVFKYPLTEAQLARYLQDPNRLAFKVVHSKTQEVIGHAEIYRRGDHLARLCRILIGDPKYRGKGLGQKLVEQLVSFSFNKLGVTAVELGVYDWNEVAVKCYEKVGFEINPEKHTTTAINESV